MEKGKGVIKDNMAEEKKEKAVVVKRTADIPEEFEQEEAVERILAPDISGEIDIQIRTAKRYPRSIAKFRQDALSMATADATIASSCFYKLKRKSREGGEAIIEGPSVRLAEIVANAWGNLRFGARIIHETDKEVTAQGMTHDLEKNVCVMIEVGRRITTRDGRRYSDDMVQVTKNAACSIALRNAIFKVVPFTYAKFIYDKAKETAVGKAKTLKERRQEMVNQFAKMSVDVADILGLVEKASLEDIGLTEIETLIGVWNAIHDGDTTVEAQFGPRSGKPEVAQAQPIKEPIETYEELEAKEESPGSVITETQLRKLNVEIARSRYTDVQLRAWMINNLKIESKKDIPQDRLDEVLNWLRGGK